MEYNSNKQPFLTRESNTLGVLISEGVLFYTIFIHLGHKFKIDVIKNLGRNRNVSINIDFTYI